MKLSQIKINPNKSSGIANLSKNKKKLFRKLKKNLKKEVNVMSSIAFTKEMFQINIHIFVNNSAISQNNSYNMQKDKI